MSLVWNQTKCTGKRLLLIVHGFIREHYEVLTEQQFLRNINMRV